MRGEGIDPDLFWAKVQNLIPLIGTKIEKGCVIIITYKIIAAEAAINLACIEIEGVDDFDVPTCLIAFGADAGRRDSTKQAYKSCQEDMGLWHVCKLEEKGGRMEPGMVQIMLHQSGPSRMVHTMLHQSAPSQAALR